MEKDDFELLKALWDGEDKDRQERVVNALEILQIEETRRQIVVAQILPMIPKLKARRSECGGPCDTLQQFKRLLNEVLEGKTEFPGNADALVAEINHRVDASYL